MQTSLAAVIKDMVEGTNASTAALSFAIISIMFTPFEGGLIKFNTIHSFSVPSEQSLPVLCLSLRPTECFKGNVLVVATRVILDYP